MHATAQALGRRPPAATATQAAVLRPPSTIRASLHADHRLLCSTGPAAIGARMASEFCTPGDRLALAVRPSLRLHAPACPQITCRCVVCALLPHQGALGHPRCAAAAATAARRRPTLCRRRRRRALAVCCRPSTTPAAVPASAAPSSARPLWAPSVCCRQQRARRDRCARVHCVQVALCWWCSPWDQISVFDLNRQGHNPQA